MKVEKLQKTIGIVLLIKSILMFLLGLLGTIGGGIASVVGCGLLNPTENPDGGLEGAIAAGCSAFMGAIILIAGIAMLIIFSLTLIFSVVYLISSRKLRRSQKVSEKTISFINGFGIAELVLLFAGLLYLVISINSGVIRGSGNAIYDNLAPSIFGIVVIIIIIIFNIVVMKMLFKLRNLSRQSNIVVDETKQESLDEESNKTQENDTKEE